MGAKKKGQLGHRPTNITGVWQHSCEKLGPFCRKLGPFPQKRRFAQGWGHRTMIVRWDERTASQRLAQ